MRKTLSLLAVLVSICIQAQDAMKVLDIAADRIRKAGNVKIEYKAGIFSNGTETASSSGTMWLQESKMKLEADGIKTWYNGKTRWCYVPEANEVNIDEPNKKEMAAMNPYRFMNIYKKGFKMTVKETVLREKTGSILIDNGSSKKSALPMKF